MQLKKKSFLVPTVFTICAVSLLLTLGSWQVVRLMNKNAHVAKIEKGLNARPVTLSGINLEKPKKYYTRVRMSGRFLHEKEVHLFTGARVPKGRPGYNIITPFERSEGGVVLVDRGWTLADVKAPQLRLDSIIWGPTTIEGMVMPEEKPGHFTPANQPERNLWFWLDIEGIRDFTKLEKLPPSYIRQISPTGANSLIQNEAKVTVRNNHLSYAITWYTLAIIALVIYVLLRKQYKST